MSEKIVVLHIKNWTGISLGAEHYYGELVGYVNGEYTRIELKFPLSARGAIKLNKKNSVSYFRKGFMSHQFDTKAQVRKVALQTYRQHFPDAFALLEGLSASGDPMQVLDCPSNPVWMQDANQVWKMAEKVDYWETPEVMKVLASIWDSLMEIAA